MKRIIEFLYEDKNKKIIPSGMEYEIFWNDVVLETLRDWLGHSGLYEDEK